MEDAQYPKVPSIAHGETLLFGLRLLGFSHRTRELAGAHPPGGRDNSSGCSSGGLRVNARRVLSRPQSDDCTCLICSLKKEFGSSIA